jgi:hypothetical protein
MHRLRSPLLIVICLALVGSQFSGMHWHIGRDGFAGAAEGTATAAAATPAPRAWTTRPRSRPT